MKYRINLDGVKLIDSYLVPKGKFHRELVSIRNLHPDCPLWQRSDVSIKREWATHNLAYSLGIRRSRTKDCDLNFSLKWYVNFAYLVVGTVAMWVIK